MIYLFVKPVIFNFYNKYIGPYLSEGSFGYKLKTCLKSGLPSITLLGVPIYLISDESIRRELQSLMDTHGPEVIDAIVALGYAAQTFLTYEASLMEGIQQLSNEFANVGNFMTQV